MSVKPVVPIRGTALVNYDEGNKAFYFSGVIGMGHPRLAEGVSIISSPIVKITSTKGEGGVIETLNTIYECGEVVFNPLQKQTVKLGKNFTKNGQVTV